MQWSEAELSIGNSSRLIFKIKKWIEKVYFIFSIKKIVVYGSIDLKKFENLIVSSIFYSNLI